MSLVSLGLFLPLMVQGGSGDLDGRQFIALVRAASDGLNDVEFVYEGSTSIHENGVWRRDSQFSGVFAYRDRDQAVYVHGFQQTLGSDVGVRHTTLVHLGDENTTLEVLPDLPGVRPVANRSRGPVAAINGPTQPLRFLFLWFLRELGDTDGWNFEMQGWETIDGHECARVQVDEIAGLPRTRDRPIVRLWVDLERGGNPLRIEFVRNGKIRMRVHKVQLLPFEVKNGDPVWLPVAAVVDAGLDTPIDGAWFEEYTIASGTMRLNQDLKDERFQVDWDGPLAYSPAIRAARSHFRNAAASRPTGPIEPSEPPEVFLKRQLEEADAQAEAIVAIPPSQRFWNTTTLLQLTLAGCALVLMVVAVRLRRIS